MTATTTTNLNLNPPNSFPSTTPGSQHFSNQQNLTPVEFHSTEDVLSILLQDWIWDFFFNSDEDEVDQLMYASTNEIPATLDVRVVSQDCGNSFADSFCINELAHTALLTSFATGSSCVGFAITEVAESSLRFASRPRYTGRYVQNSSTGDFVMISHDTDLSLTEINYARVKSLSQRETMFALMDTKRLMKTLHEAKQSGVKKINPGAFREATIYHYQSEEHRQCPSCANFSCKCIVPFRKYRYGIDSEVSMHNLMIVGGGHTGRATLKLMSKGIPILTATYPSCAIFQPTSDMSLRRKLANWAIKDSVHRKASMISLPKGLSQTFGKTIVATSKPLDFADRQVITPADNFVRACVITEIEDSDSNDDDRNLGNDTNNMTELNTPLHAVNQLVQQHVNDNLSNDLQMTDTNPSIQSPTEDDLSNDLDFTVSINPIVVENLFTSETNEMGQKPDEIGMNNIPEVIATTSAAVSITGEDDSNKSSSCSSVKATETNLTTNYATSIQPRSGYNDLDSYSERARRTAAEIVAKDAENRRNRLEERKRRNRLAAARSNERRRQAMDKLKLDIANASKTEKRLREKESELRKRNALLRERIQRERDDRIKL